VPARIKSVRQTGAAFAPRKKFSLEARLRDSFGVQSGLGTFEVVLHFNRGVADYIREKRWHDSQRLRDLEDGGVELRMKLSSLSEVERWVLNWGGNARVKEPAELADSVRAAAQRILDAHLES
jgi:predicted DNA-binding transcriptional regulator YafY